MLGAATGDGERLGGDWSRNDDCQFGRLALPRVGAGFVAADDGRDQLLVDAVLDECALRIFDWSFNR